MQQRQVKMRINVAEVNIFSYCDNLMWRTLGKTCYPPRPGRGSARDKLELDSLR